MVGLNSSVLCLYLPILTEPELKDAAKSCFCRISLLNDDHRQYACQEYHRTTDIIHVIIAKRVGGLSIHALVGK